MKTLDWINDADLLSRDYLSKIKGGNATVIDTIDWDDSSIIDTIDTDDTLEKHTGDSDSYSITASN